MTVHLPIIQISRCQNFLLFFLFCSHRNVGGFMEGAESFVQISFLHKYCFILKKKNHMYEELTTL